jgi:hypothetical protein
VPGHVRGSCDATLRAVAEPFGASVSECIRAFSAD